ncbi:MAG: flagellin [Bdellovibrionales bacterium RIFOXYD1_FULL_53_11]|nr:MAG: flagellin [Bdellovibrionales bacterium RIFOXYD1_FULL_53_11]
MGLRVNTNTQSIAAQRSLGINNKALQSSLEKLSSGTRITHAADDAAGLAIAEKMRADIRSIGQSMRNASDGISMIQTAEGAMSEIGSILIRFRELSIQAASDTIGDTERGFIDKEVQQLRMEVDRIAQATEYNGKKVLNGETEAIEIQIGNNNDPELDRFTYNIEATNVTADALGVSDITVATKEDSQNNLEKIDSAIKLLSENRAELGALQNRLHASVSNTQIYSENLQGARSRIYDVDMASETSELTRTQILAQASTSVLGQANQNSTLALKLLA